VQLPLLWVPKENLSWYSVLNIYHKVTIAVKCRLIGDSFCQNLLILNQHCWSYLKMYQGSGFLRHSVGQLKESGLVCHIGSMYFGCVVYADDLVILAASLTMLQAMIDLCACIAENELNMSFNVKNSAIVRIGPAFRHLCACVNLKGCAIHYVETVRYLDVHIRCGKYFRLSTKESKGDFYRAVNALCSKTKYKLDNMVMLHLVTSFCRPLLVYGAECIKFTPRYDNAVKSSWNCVFWRIFRVSDSLADDISQYTGTSTITSFVLQQRIRFRQKMSCSLNMSEKVCSFFI